MQPVSIRQKRVLLALVLSVAFAMLAAAASAVAAPWIGVKGNHFVNRNGHPVRLLGVNRSGMEYACQQGWGFFDGPSDAASIRVMKSVFEATAKEAKAACPVSRALAGVPEINLTARLDD